MLFVSSPVADRDVVRDGLRIALPNALTVAQSARLLAIANALQRIEKAARYSRVQHVQLVLRSLQAVAVEPQSSSSSVRSRRVGSSRPLWSAALEDAWPPSQPRTRATVYSVDAARNAMQALSNSERGSTIGRLLRRSLPSSNALRLLGFGKPAWLDGSTRLNSSRIFSFGGLALRALGVQAFSAHAAPADNLYIALYSLFAYSIALPAAAEANSLALLASPTFFASQAQSPVV